MSVTLSQYVLLPLWILRILRVFFDLPSQRPLEKVIEDLRAENEALRAARGEAPPPTPESTIERARREADEEILRLERLLNPTMDHQGVVDLAKALFEPLQNLRRALASPGEGVVEGVAMTLKQIEEALEVRGFERIDPKYGDPFDPRIHEAVDVLPSTVEAHNCIESTAAVGYWYKATQAKVLLLPAKVVVGRYS